MAEYLDPGAFWQKRLSRSFDLTGAGYGTLGLEYNNQLYRVRSETLEQLLQAQAVDLAQTDVLEVGCGTGFYTDWFTRRAVRSYTGVDITSVSVQRLQEHYGQWKFVRADVTASALPLRRRFDLVLIADVLFHIVDDRRFGAALRNIAQVLRPGGVLVLSDILGASTAQTVAHCRWRSYADYQAALTAAGFRVQRLQPIFAALQPPAELPSSSWRWRLYTRLWRHVLFRIARNGWFDYYVPPLLARLDRDYLLPMAGVMTPNTKWLVAVSSAPPDA